jgi:hypothetical protein
MRCSSGSYIIVLLLMIPARLCMAGLKGPRKHSDYDLLSAKIGYFTLTAKFLGHFYCNHFKTHIVLYFFICSVLFVMF